MGSLQGPWSDDIASFRKSLKSLPEIYKAAFTTASTNTLGKITSPNALHVWDCSSDLDSLLQLTSVIASLCNLGVRTNKGANDDDGAMLILAEENRGQRNFQRICALVAYLTCIAGKAHLDGTVEVFGKIVVVRGWDTSVVEGQAEALEKTIKRVNVAVERVFEMGGFGKGDKKRKIIWHQGPVVWFLVAWIHGTSSQLKRTLAAITVTDALNHHPTGTGGTDTSSALPRRSNLTGHLELLEKYARRLQIPVVFLDTGSQDIAFEYLGTYMYFFAYYINTYIPATVLRGHLYKAQDELVTFAFRLRAASEGRYGSDVVKIVKKHLDASTAKPWARMCVDEASYEKTKCRAAGKDEAIHHAVQLADSPFALLSSRTGVPAFARLAVGPASASAQDYYTAVPCALDFSSSPSKTQIRPKCPANLYILIPQQESQTMEKVTNRVQGVMMAVLERVRQEKGNPVLGEAERDMWKAVVKACEWAIGGSEGKMPRSVEEKVRFVREKLKEGTWGYAVEPRVAPVTVPANANAVATPAAAPVVAANAMPAPRSTYGFGMGTQQTMGPPVPGAAQQMMPQQQMTPQQQMPQQSTAFMGQQLPQQGVYPPAQGQGMNMGQGQQQYAPNPMAGGPGPGPGPAPGYPQNIGQPWSW
ncbi:hypothetical protein GMOD_00000958 [Pyrenophora seminiperda CCB06]|uniref:Uncharacterized protein n=1 Tax=Pyrenophora seminiperda CCB06 TaxID=1302712 RepID=A0A3M7LY74_9PLEO|nr:hypothetical protein GMOD_00000958 [Pyrenophora seminiperda CCB06]